MTDSTVRRVSLLNEISTAVGLLKKGLGDLQAISGANDFYHPPILLLSSGFERLIKCLLCLAKADDDGRLAETPYETRGRKGHDLLYLLDKLLLVCSAKDYASRFPAAKADIDLLNTPRLREIVSLLSDFAQGGRYHNLDVFLTGSSKYPDPEQQWSKIEMAVVKSKGEPTRQIMQKPLDELYDEINRELVIVLERFARALSRLFTLADFGKLAKQASPLVCDFLMLTDDDLGKRDHRGWPRAVRHDGVGGDSG